MKIPSPRSVKKARIEIVPLIDIIFFLLATFVMVSLSMVKSKGVPVNLPVASTGENQDRKDFVTLSITEDGSLYMDKEKVTPEALRVQMTEYKARVQNPKVIINGDAKAQFGSAIAVLDDIRRIGINTIAIETRQGEKK